MQRQRLRFVCRAFTELPAQSKIATDCLESICTGSASDLKLLFACVLEAQKVGDHPQVLLTLRRVIEMDGYGLVRELHLPALLR